MPIDPENLARLGVIHGSKTSCFEYLARNAESNEMLGVFRTQQFSPQARFHVRDSRAGTNPRSINCWISSGGIRIAREDSRTTPIFRREIHNRTVASLRPNLAAACATVSIA